MLLELDRENLHHAYVLEGDLKVVLPSVLEFIDSLGVSLVQNPDFIHLTFDTIKIEDARNLKNLSLTKNTGNKKIFLITTNNFLPEAQNTLLKIFEEPTADTHFFLIIPDANILLPTLFSRVYYVSQSSDSKSMDATACEFLALTPRVRIEWLKEFLAEDEEELVTDSARSKALRFLNSLEKIIHKKFLTSDKKDSFGYLTHIFKVRENLRMPGSATKTLLESVALAIPNF